jgi:hypothetical protein
VDYAGLLQSEKLLMIFNQIKDTTMIDPTDLYLALRNTDNVNIRYPMPKYLRYEYFVRPTMEFGLGKITVKGHVHDKQRDRS